MTSTADDGWDLVGTGLFLGTGRALSTGGPGSLLINYSLVGALVYLVMLCLGYVTLHSSVCEEWNDEEEKERRD